MPHFYSLYEKTTEYIRILSSGASHVKPSPQFIIKLIMLTLCADFEEFGEQVAISS